jgi:hypothetical protein
MLQTRGIATSNESPLARAARVYSALLLVKHDFIHCCQFDCWRKGVLAAIQASFAVPIALSLDFGPCVRGSDGETVAGEASQTSGHSVT